MYRVLQPHNLIPRMQLSTTERDITGDQVSSKFGAPQSCSSRHSQTSSKKPVAHVIAWKIESLPLPPSFYPACTSIRGSKDTQKPFFTHLTEFTCNVDVWTRLQDPRRGCEVPICRFLSFIFSWPTLGACSIDTVIEWWKLWELC